MASKTIKQCYLQCLKNKAKRIPLTDNKIVILGRNEESEITDLNVSRKQLECIAKFDLKKVFVKVVGKCYSGCNGYALKKNETYHLKPGDIIEVKLGSHLFNVVFEEPGDCSELPTKKAKFSVFTINQPNAKSKINGIWEAIDNNELLIFTPEDCSSQQTIAAFDLDGTIIRTKSGARFPKDQHDWVLNFNNITEILNNLYHKQMKIVIFTNQAGVGRDSHKIKAYKSKVESILETLSVPIQVFVSLTRSIYRKPAPGMWNALLSKNDEPIDLSRSFFVGDAAGREKNWAYKKNKDHSIADRLFALNIGLKFYTPEEYFIKSSTVSHIMPEFDPAQFIVTEYPNFLTDKQDVIIMVGSQGSGKSSFCKTELIPNGYKHISRDDLGSWQKCVRVLQECLEQRQNAVVDNTNPDQESRQKFVEIVKKHGINCRCFVMQTSFNHSKHNNKFREFTDKSHIPVTDMILHTFKKKFEEPVLSEGFSEILKIPFVPKFVNNEDEKLYKMFLCES